MRDVIDVRIRQGGGWFWPCFIIFFAIWYWKWVLLVIGLISAAFLLAWGIKCLMQDMRDQRHIMQMQQYNEEARKLRLAHNAVIENALFHAGDPRGTYGLDYHDGQGQRR